MGRAGPRARNRFRARRGAEAGSAPALGVGAAGKASQLADDPDDELDPELEEPELEPEEPDPVDPDPDCDADPDPAPPDDRESVR